MEYHVTFPSGADMNSFRKLLKQSNKPISWAGCFANFLDFLYNGYLCTVTAY